MTNCNPFAWGHLLQSPAGTAMPPEFPSARERRGNGRGSPQTAPSLGVLLRDVVYRLTGEGLSWVLACAGVTGEGSGNGGTAEGESRG